MNLFRPPTREEIANTITHGAGLFFSLLATPFLVYWAKQTADYSLLYATVIYSFCLICLYAISTLYHSMPAGNNKKLLRKLDHMAIYFMIAGSYTPFVVGILEDGTQILFMGLLWSFVLLGIVFKVFATGKFENLSMTLYILMGWMVLFEYKTFYECLSNESLLYVFSGGLAYMIGIYFYRNDHRPYFHSIWHIFTLLGSICHYMAIAYLL